MRIWDVSPGYLNRQSLLGEHREIHGLAEKYRSRPPGRIPLPRNAQALWAHHKYSVLARDTVAYEAIGRRVARMRRGADLGGLAEELIDLLRADPGPGTLVNALEHMWGHVSDVAAVDDRRAVRQSTSAMLARTRELALRLREPYLLSSTALGELALFVRDA